MSGTNTNKPSDEFVNKVYPKVGEKLYLNENLSDFHFTFKLDDGQIERVPAHKIILAAASDVFEVMFNGSWEEKTEVEIVDATPGAFREFQQFFYLGKFKLTVENAAEVLNLGKKYNVKDCFEICGEFMAQNLTIDDNLCSIFEVAVHLEHKKLLEKCTKQVSYEMPNILSSGNFLALDRKTVKYILQMNSFNCSEFKMFEALLQWIKAKTKQDELIKEIIQGGFSDLIHEIRFGSMTQEDFCRFHWSYADLFTCNEHKEIVQLVLAKDFEPKIFKGNVRTGFQEWNKDAVLLCVLIESSSVYYIPGIDTTTFSVNKMVYLGAFTLSTLWDLSNNYELTSSIGSEGTIVETSDSNQEMVLYNGGTVLKSACRVSLPKPIRIRRGFMYKIQLQQTPPEKSYTYCQLKSNVDVTPNTTIQFEATGWIKSLEFNASVW